ncbi:MAG: hypothetical protein ACR2NU_07820 [Aeoliella sp.]
MRRIPSNPVLSLQVSLLWVGVACCSIVFMLPSNVAVAQERGDEERQRDRDDDRRGDRDRGEDRRGDDRRRWGRESGESDDERRARFMRSMDKNGDGKIERSEVYSDRMWESISRRAEEGGLDTSKALSLDKYLSTRKEQERRARGESVENANAFGGGDAPAKAPGFDTPLTPEELVMLNPDRSRTTSFIAPSGESSASSNESSSKSSSRESGSDRTERYARSLVERYDKNGNNILEKEEWKEMRGDPEKSDLNRDGKVTYDELVKRFNSGRDDDRSKSDDRRRSYGGRGTSSKDDKDARRTYRFTSPLERLQDKARSWVEKYDDNADGQVAMAEFSRTWTDSKVREFERHDLDNDGVVTGEEYLESK